MKHPPRPIVQVQVQISLSVPFAMGYSDCHGMKVRDLDVGHEGGFFVPPGLQQPPKTNWNSEGGRGRGGGIRQKKAILCGEGEKQNSNSERKKLPENTGEREQGLSCVCGCLPEKKATKASAHSRL